MGKFVVELVNAVGFSYFMYELSSGGFLSERIVGLCSEERRLQLQFFADCTEP
jgi:hypothetical protein